MPKPIKELKVRIIIELLGAPQKHIDDTMKLVMQKIKELKNIKVTSENIFASKKLKDKPLWSTFTEFEATFKDFQVLLGFCFEYMPSSVEIIEPANPHLENRDMSDLFNDLLARLHQYDMLLKNFRAENFMLKKKIEKS